MQIVKQILMLLGLVYVVLPRFASAQSEDVVELFLVRGFLGGTDYERFSLKGDGMWYECGEVSDLPQTEIQPMTADKYLPQNARLKASQREIAKLDDQRASAIAAQIKQLLAADFDGKLLPPGSILGLAGAGLIELRIVSAESVKTITASVDEVSEGSGKELELLRTFIQYVRGSGGVLCGHETFYAIKRQL